MIWSVFLSGIFIFSFYNHLLTPNHIKASIDGKSWRILWKLPELETCFALKNSGHQQGSCDEKLPITAKTISCLINHALNCLNELLCHHTIQCDLWSQFFYYDKSRNVKHFLPFRWGKFNQNFFSDLSHSSVNHF